MNKIYLWGGVLCLTIGIVVCILMSSYYSVDIPGMVPSATTTDGVTEQTVTTSPKNATYLIEGVPVTLINGTAETAAAPGSASMVETDYFGNEATYDFNADGRLDTAFLLVQSTGGTGIFYYLVAALNEEGGYRGSVGVRIGDRIAPQSTVLQNGVVEVNYADRAPDEAFSVLPSVGKTVRFSFDAQTMTFSLIPSTGTTSTSVQNIMGRKWQWVRTNYTDGRVFVPKNTTAFSLTFGADGRVSGTTDCNSVSGPYTARGTNTLMFGRMAMTKMYCDGSEEGVFADILGQIATYAVTSSGELYLGLKAGSGTMILQ